MSSGRADWEYPREEPHYWTFPAVDCTVSELTAEFPVSGDLTQAVRKRRHSTLFRDEDVQQP